MSVFHCNDIDSAELYELITVIRIWLFFSNLSKVPGRSSSKKQFKLFTIRKKEQTLQENALLFTVTLQKEEYVEFSCSDIDCKITRTVK